jgi:hypothetical protein
MNKCYNKKGLLRIDVEQSCKPPLGYGICYWRYDIPVAVCYPLILNWVVWFCRETYFKIAYGIPHGFPEDVYKAGIEEGRRIQRILDNKE